jgi:hypothetical protein
VGVVLTVAAADILPDAVTTAMLLVALGLLVESFGRSVWGLWVPGMSLKSADAAAAPHRDRSAPLPEAHPALAPP